MYDLIAVGDIVMDTHVQIDQDAADCHLRKHNGVQDLCLTFGSKIPIIHSFQSLGGNVANVAAGATMLGLKSTIVTTLGNDANAQMAIEDLKKRKIDTKYITFDHHSATRYSIILNYADDRTILSYSDKKRYTWPKRMPSAPWFYYAGLSEGYQPMHAEMLAYLSLHPDTKLVINPGSHILKYAFSSLKELLPRTNVLICNLEEAEKISGKKLRRERSIKALLHHLLAMGPKEVAITDGPRGAWVGNAHETWHMEAFPVIVVSKTGAGDAFSSGYLAARAHNYSIKEALIWGIANSSSLVQDNGSMAGLLDHNGIRTITRIFSSVEPMAL